MVGVILAAGKGTKLLPFTHLINKSLLPIYKKPMIYYPLETLINSGVKNIGIVIQSKHIQQFKTVIGYYPKIKQIKITYVIQRKQLGMAHAIYESRSFVKHESFILIPGDAILDECYRKELNNFKDGAVAFLRKVNDPSRFGAIKTDKRGNVIKIVEKPKMPQTNYAVAAPYIFDNNYFNHFNNIRLSKRGEYEITDILNIYLKNKNLHLIKSNKKWFDVGTFESLHKAANHIVKKDINRSL